MNFIAILIVGLLIVFATIGVTIMCVNNVPMSQSPGIFRRLKFYFSASIAETAPDADLPELRTRQYDMKPEALYDLCCLACRRLGWDIARQSSETMTLEVSAPNALIGRGDLITIKCSQLGRFAMLNVRSRSGLTGVDFGANLRHIMDLHDQVDAIIRINAASRTQAVAATAG